MTTTSANTMGDVKQPRAFIPPVPVAGSSRTASHGYFKVFMFVEAEPNQFQEMIPITIEKPEEALAVQRFVAIPGKAFYCRVELSRAPPEGQLWGCRVYIDKGCKHREAFDVAKGGDDDEEENQNPSNGNRRVDRSEPDHFFWFGPGETSFTDRGFYRNNEEDYGFKFGELSRSAGRCNLATVDNIKEIQGGIGIIRFQFARVKEMKPRKGRKYYYNEPSLSTDFVDGMLKRKGSHVCTDVGKRIKNGTQRIKEEAVLEKEIAYESRIIFNDLAGFQAQQEFRLYQEPTRLRALPLAEFNVSKPKRRFFIELFLTWLQNNRYTQVEEFLQPDAAPPAGSEGPVLNSAVGTEDLLHFINATLSPTASYIVCTGKQVPANFHVRETLVQMRKVTAKQRNKWFAKKEAGLIAFFQSDPDNYELVSNGVDEKGRRLYDVKKSTVVVLEGSDSDSD